MLLAGVLGVVGVEITAVLVGAGDEFVEAVPVEGVDVLVAFEGARSRQNPE